MVQAEERYHATTSNTGFPSSNGFYHGLSTSSSNAAWPTIVSHSFTTIFQEGQPPKVFIVFDVDKGIAVLESADVKYSVTGGEVERCYPLLASGG